MRFIYIFGQCILLDDGDAMIGNLLLRSKSICCLACASKKGLASVTTAQQKGREMSVGGTNIVCGNSIPPPPPAPPEPTPGVLHHMNELMLLISLQRVLGVCGNNHRPEFTNPVGILAQKETIVFNPSNNPPPFLSLGRASTLSFCLDLCTVRGFL